MAATSFGEEYLPAGPFLAWLRDQEARLEKAPAITGQGARDPQPVRRTLARRLGITIRTLRRFTLSLNDDGVPVTIYPRGTIEDILWRVDLSLWEVYPDADANEAVPADEWCDRCDEMVTPIWEKGALVCPWCTPPAVVTCDVPGCSTLHARARLCQRHLRMEQEGPRVERWEPESVAA